MQQTANTPSIPDCKGKINRKRWCISIQASLGMWHHTLRCCTRSCKLRSADLPVRGGLKTAHASLEDFHVLRSMTTSLYERRTHPSRSSAYSCGLAQVQPHCTSADTVFQDVDLVTLALKILKLPSLPRPKLFRARLLKTASTPLASTMAAPVAELLAIILRLFDAFWLRPSPAILLNEVSLK